MNIIEFNAAVSALLPLGSAVEVLVWNHGPGRTPEPKYSAWSSQHNRHFHGATPELVIESLREWLEPAPQVDGDASALDDLGELPIAALKALDRFDAEHGETSSELPVTHNDREHGRNAP